MAWHASLTLDYTRDGSLSYPAGLGKTIARFSHNGPLRILQSLYPEGDSICHNVLIHPPGGLAAGDTLDINISGCGDAHGLVTTPGATRFYRSDGALARQITRLRLSDAARLEWLPLEALCYSGCIAENRLQIELAKEAEFIGWDVTALGLPNAQAPFEKGSFTQHIEVPGVWLEHGHIDALDTRLLQGPQGLAGHSCMATLFFVGGAKIGRARKQSLLDVARELIADHPLCTTAGVTSPNEQVVVLRALAPLVEPAMLLLRTVWSAWRTEAWGITGTSPRIWST